MRRWLLVLVVALVAVGCDKELSRTEMGTHREQKQVSCQHVGVCYSCGMDARGRYNCGFGLRPSCEGHQDADVDVTTYRSTYESGKVQDWTDEQVIRRVGACQ